jgi:hypothetical protein
MTTMKEDSTATLRSDCVLPVLDPTRDGADEECPGLDRRAHDGFWLAFQSKRCVDQECSD